MEEIKFALDTFYAIMSGALVMWMAAGFTMLEAGLVQKKDVSEIVTKNLGLFSIACVMYLVCGFVLMYVDVGSYIGSLGGMFYNPTVDELALLDGADNVAAILLGGLFCSFRLVLSNGICCNRSFNSFTRFNKTSQC